MMAVEQNNAVATGVEATAAAVTYYSQNVGVTFKNTNPVATNPIITDALSKMGEDEVTVEDGMTTFSVDSKDLAHFLHLAYCNTPDGKKLRVDFDGIYPFNAVDTNTGLMTKFNAQLVTMAEVDE